MKKTAQTVDDWHHAARLIIAEIDPIGALEMELARAQHASECAVNYERECDCWMRAIRVAIAKAKGETL